MIINNNIASINSNRVLSFKNRDVSMSMERLSSGMRINKAGDDASGLAVSEKLRTQIRGLNQALRNTQDGISFVQTTEGYLKEIGDIIQRIRELAIQSSNGIYTTEDRMQIQAEVSQLVDEMDRVASQAQFNSLNMLTGRFAVPQGENNVTNSMWFHMGPNSDQRERVYIGTMTTQALGLRSLNGAPTAGTFISISTPGKANSVLNVLDNALMKINRQRASLGAYQNKLEMAMEGTALAAENLQAAESRIRDTDMAKVMSDLVKDQVIAQAGTSMVAQANQRTQQVLALLQ